MKYRIALLFVLALAAFLRLYSLGTAAPGLYHDEAMNGIDCLRNIENHKIEVFYPDNVGREGLFINLATPSVYCFGNTAWALRFPAAIFGVLTVLGVYLLAAELFPRPVALISSFFVATSFWHILISRMALRANAAPVFLAFSVYLLLRGLGRSAAGQGNWGITLAAGIVYGLGFHSYLAYRATPVLIGAIFLYGFITAKGPDRRIALWKGLATFCAGAALALLPLVLYFVHHPAAAFGRISQVSVFNNSPNPAWEIVLNAWRTGRMFFVRGDRTWRYNIAYRAELYWPVAVFFAIGLFRALAARRAQHWLVLSWLVVGAAPVVLSDDFLPNALRSVLLIPPAFILAGIGAYTVHGWVAARIPRPLLAAGAAALAILLIYDGSDSYFRKWAKSREAARAMEADASAVARRLNVLPRALPKYVASYVAGEPRQVLPAQIWVLQYLTRTYTSRLEENANIHYLPLRRAPGPPGEACGNVSLPAHPGGVDLCLEYVEGM